MSRLSKKLRFYDAYSCGKRTERYYEVYLLKKFSSSSSYIFYRAGFINNMLHSLHGYILNSRLPFNSQITFTRIGTFYGDQVLHLQQFICNIKINDVDPATVCTTGEYMHYISGQASNTTFFPNLKSLPWRHNQEIPLFLWGQCSASCAKVNMASRQAILIFTELTAEAVQLWYLLCTVNGLYPLTLMSCTIGSMHYYEDAPIILYTFSVELSVH